MTQSRQYRLSHGIESSLGTTPSSFEVLQTSSASPSMNVPKQRVDTIRNDANIAGMVTLNRSASFTRSQDFFFPTTDEGLYNELLAVMRTAAGDIGAQVEDTSVSLGGAVISGIADTTGWAAGDIVRLYDSTTAADDGFYPIASVDSGTQVTLDLPTGVSIAGSAAGIINGRRLPNGVTDRSFTLEEVWLDPDGVTAGKMCTWSGMRVASVGFGFSMNSKTTYTCTYVGQDGDPTSDMTSATVGIAGASYSNPASNAPVYSPEDAIMVVANDKVIPCQSLQVSIGTGARTRHSTSGGATPDAVPTGTFTCNISLTVYASLLDLLTDFRAGTAVPFYYGHVGPDDTAIAISCEDVTWDSASLPTSGLDSDALITVSGTATLTSDRSRTALLTFFA